jgi:hypothetical protein
MKRFNITLTLTDAEVGKLLHIMRSIRKTDDWTDDAKSIVVKLQCAVEDLNLVDDE